MVASDSGSSALTDRQRQRKTGRMACDSLDRRCEYAHRWPTVLIQTRRSPSVVDIAPLSWLTRWQAFVLVKHINTASRLQGNTNSPTTRLPHRMRYELDKFIYSVEYSYDKSTVSCTSNRQWILRPKDSQSSQDSSSESETESIDNTKPRSLQHGAVNTKRPSQPRRLTAGQSPDPDSPRQTRHTSSTRRPTTRSNRHTAKPSSHHPSRKRPRHIDYFRYPDPQVRTGLSDQSHIYPHSQYPVHPHSRGQPRDTNRSRYAAPGPNSRGQSRDISSSRPPAPWSSRRAAEPSDHPASQGQSRHTNHPAPQLRTGLSGQYPIYPHSHYPVYPHSTNRFRRAAPGTNLRGQSGNTSSSRLPAPWSSRHAAEPSDHPVYPASQGQPRHTDHPAPQPSTGPYSRGQSPLPKRSHHPALPKGIPHKTDGLWWIGY